ncbi:MAG TPA: toll/interleukin-1 receptor domain-containing protein, partial [Thermoanaerobaculia bacterium]|nr:toll/interleukin-1 receptor domain-containing protein [Thermoanaerobaculia bacterium]
MLSPSLSVFLSYSRDSEKHVDWVTRFANSLEADSAFSVMFDEYDLHAGKDLTQFMEAGVRCDRVVVVVTSEYVRKSIARSGGVGYESTIISAFLLEEKLRDRVIPVLREGSERPPHL